MVRPSPELVAAAAPYVPVRVLDMRGVDLNVYRFDYDLTFAVLLMNADGTIYARYGGRDHESADGYLSSGTLAALLRDTEVIHRGRLKWPAARPPPPEPRPARTAESIPPFARRLADAAKRGERTGCIHCHMVHEAERELAQEEKRWTRDAIWLWPDPERVGIAVDPADQTLVRSVTPESPAARAGLAAGDRLVNIQDRRVRTRADIQALLHDEPGGATALSIIWMREGKAQQELLALPAGWKGASALEWGWRPSKWLLTPDPGFGGQCLDAAEKARLALPPDAFALRIGYLIDWGERARTGRSAKAAGLRNGDVVLSVGGKRDFQHHDHFQAWFRLEAKVGQTLDVEILRAGERRTLWLPVIE